MCKEEMRETVVANKITAAIGGEEANLPVEEEVNLLADITRKRKILYGNSAKTSILPVGVTWCHALRNTAAVTDSQEVFSAVRKRMEDPHIMHSIDHSTCRRLVARLQIVFVSYNLRVQCIKLCVNPTQCGCRFKHNFFSPPRELLHG